MKVRVLELGIVVPVTVLGPLTMSLMVPSEPSTTPLIALLGTAPVQLLFANSL